MSSLRADPEQRVARGRAVATRSRTRPRRRWKLPRLPGGRRTFIALAGCVAVAGAAIALGPLGALHDFDNVAIAVTGVGGLRVEQVEVQGRHMVDRAMVLKAVDVKRGEPIFAVDLGAVRSRLEQIPWIETATVERRLPDLVYVRLIERQPLALWQHEGRFSVIDAKGVVVLDGNVGSYANLPLVVGPDAPARADALLQLLATEPELKARVAAAVRVGGRRWNLHLDNGVDVKLPEDDAAGAIGKLADINRQNQLIDRDVRVIDLRMPDRLVLQVGPNSAERLRMQTKTSQNGG